MMGGTSTADLESAFDTSFRRALILSVGVGAIAAVGLATFATRRILAPLDSVRRASRRMATGSYSERVDVPEESELAAVAEDVNSLAEALQETESRRVRLVAEVAHELRTPLTTIEGYLEGLLDGVFEPSDEILAASSREVRRLKRLVADLGELSKADADSRLDTVTVDLAELAGTVVEQLRPQADAKRITVQVDLESSASVLGDPDRLTQVLTNIIGNAVAYTPDGGGIDISVDSDPAAGRALVRVTDTGKGLQPQELTAVFDRFYRADPQAPGGTGIGLSIAQSIARRHGGEVTAESAGLHQGSTFTISLPLA
jgi:histidine kinase